MSTIQTLNDAERNAPKKSPFKSSDSAKARMARIGKTKKDRARGAAHKNEQNRQARAAWQNDSKSTFPTSSCNGKKNRYQVTGKDGQTVYVREKRK